MSEYAYLPAVSDTHKMVSWVLCPVHHQKVGIDSWGHVLGRCQGCAEEAAQATTRLEAEALYV